jgi:DNA-binding NarL/FixJ family response regulator
MMDAGPSILITEDHATTRLGIRQILEEQLPGARIGEAGDARTTRELLALERWDLLLLDISLPDESGFNLLRDAREHPELRVLVFSAHPEDPFALHAIRAGAAGYLTKERAPEELVTAVRAILAGGRHLSPELALRLQPGHASAAGLPHSRLSKRELEVLRLLASGVPGKAIAQQLGLSPKTVSTYRGRVLAKLGLESTAALIRYAVAQRLL